MDKKLLILSILTLLSVVGAIFLQTGISNNAFLAGFGYFLAALSLIIAISVAMAYK